MAEVEERSGGESRPWRWNCYPDLVRKNVFPNDLAQAGIKVGRATFTPTSPHVHTGFTPG